MESLFFPNLNGGFLFRAVGILLLSVCSRADPPTSFVFGDSLLDCGNNNYIRTLAKANFAPNGIDFPPLGQPTGRYTNGRTIIDILGQELGMPQFPRPFLDPGISKEDFRNGVNYASGGGGILQGTGRVFIGRISMDDQISAFARHRDALMDMMGPQEATKLLRNALFSIAIGSNDLINNYFWPVAAASDRNSYTPDMFVGAMISKFQLQLTKLYELDARKIVVANIGPVGCIPFQMDTVSSGSYDGCATLPNQMAQSFNDKLRYIFADLHQNLEGAIFVYADVYRVVMDLIQNYKEYGFDTANIACCKLAGVHGGLVPCGPQSNVCSDRSKYLFWDPFHPSDSANILIAKRLLDGNSNDIFPMNVRQLALMKIEEEFS